MLQHEWRPMPISRSKHFSPTNFHGLCAHVNLVCLRYRTACIATFLKAIETTLAICLQLYQWLNHYEKFKNFNRNFVNFVNYGSFGS